MTPEEFADRLRKLALREGMTFATLATLNAVDRSVLIATIAAQFDPDEVYAERQVNERLQAWLDGVAANVQTDRVTLRRWLVDTGVMSRADDCSDYRLTDAGELRAVAQTLDGAAIALATRNELAAKRIARKAAWLSQSSVPSSNGATPPSKA